MRPRRTTGLVSRAGLNGTVYRARVSWLTMTQPMPVPPGSPGAPGKPELPRSHAHALHAPWRLSYLEMLGAAEAERANSQLGNAENEDAARGKSESPPTGSAPKPKPNCFLREYWLNPSHDERNHVIVRTGRPDSSPQAPGPKPQACSGGLILLNRYPYANGHLLICLGESRPRLLDYGAAQRAELWSLVDLAVELCERTLRCQGVNVGLNQGMAAGAGVPEHAHIHVVPRWFGDVNFMSVVGHVRVIPSALDDMAKRYREVWQDVKKEHGV